MNFNFGKVPTRGAKEAEKRLIEARESKILKRKSGRRICRLFVDSPEAEASGSTAKLSPTRQGAAVTAERLDERVRLLQGAELANCSIRKLNLICTNAWPVCLRPRSRPRPRVRQLEHRKQACKGRRWRDRLMYLARNFLSNAGQASPAAQCILTIHDL